MIELKKLDAGPEVSLLVGYVENNEWWDVLMVWWNTQQVLDFLSFTLHAGRPARKALQWLTGEISLYRELDGLFVLYFNVQTESNHLLMAPPSSCACPDVTMHSRYVMASPHVERMYTERQTVLICLFNYLKHILKRHTCQHSP